jgi:phage terminase large subunit-like protein
MVEATIRMVDNNVPVTTVWASRGKVVRAFTHRLDGRNYRPGL